MLGGPETVARNSRTTVHGLTAPIPRTHTRPRARASQETCRMEQPVLEIKKYPNRRYYDTSRSVHITIEDILRLIRSGRTVRITDSKTGEDLTARVLTQLILDHDPIKLAVFRDDLLHRLIRSNERIVHDFVEKYLNQAFQAFIDSHRHFEQFLRANIGLPTATGQGDSPPEDTAADTADRDRPADTAPDHRPPAGTPTSVPMMFNPLAAFWLTGAAPPSPPTPASDTSSDLRAEIQQLRDEVARLRKARPRPTRKSRSTTRPSD